MVKRAMIVLTRAPSLFDIRTRLESAMLYPFVSSPRDIHLAGLEQTPTSSWITFVYNISEAFVARL